MDTWGFWKSDIGTEKSVEMFLFAIHLSRCFILKIHSGWVFVLLFNCCNSKFLLLLYAKLGWELGFKGQCVPAGGIRKDFVLFFFFYFKKFQLGFWSHFHFWGSLRCDALCSVLSLGPEVSCFKKCHPKHFFVSAVYLAWPLVCDCSIIHGAAKVIWRFIKKFEVFMSSAHTRTLTRYSTGDRVRIIFLYHRISSWKGP